MIYYHSHLFNTWGAAAERWRKSHPGWMEGWMDGWIRIRRMDGWKEGRKEILKPFREIKFLTNSKSSAILVVDSVYLRMILDIRISHTCTRVHTHAHFAPASFSKPMTPQTSLPTAHITISPQPLAIDFQALPISCDQPINNLRSISRASCYLLWDVCVCRDVRERDSGGACARYMISTLSWWILKLTKRWGSNHCGFGARETSSSSAP